MHSLLRMCNLNEVHAVKLEEKLLQFSVCDSLTKSGRCGHELKLEYTARKNRKKSFLKNLYKRRTLNPINLL